MKAHNLPHVGKMTQKMVELQDGRTGIVDYRLTTKSDSTVMVAIHNEQGKLGGYQEISVSKIK